MPSFFLMIRPPPRSPLFPYPTPFRSQLRPRHLFRQRLDVVHHERRHEGGRDGRDRKSTRLNSSHGYISYAVFFFNDPATPEISPLPLPDALPISTSPAPPLSPTSRCRPSRAPPRRRT